MRLLLGAVILLALFSAAALWQRSWTEESRSNRAPFPSEVSGPFPETETAGWSRVVLGRPSGGEPYGGPPAAVGESPERDGPKDHAQPPIQAPRRDSPETPLPSPAPGPTQPEKDPLVLVQAGQTLSEICRDHYGTARHELVLAVARYNQLAGPDSIREGQEILLPTLESLHETR